MAGSRQKIIDCYNKHTAKVQEFFTDDPSRLLELDIINGDGWDKLCRFLGKGVPDLIFPHLNPTDKRLIEKKEKAHAGGLRSKVKSFFIKNR